MVKSKPHPATEPDTPQLQALRDLYLIHKSVELDQYRVAATEVESAGITSTKAGLTYANSLQSGLARSLGQYRLLLTETKLKNAVLSTCVVALAQQLYGSRCPERSPTPDLLLIEFG